MFLDGGDHAGWEDIILVNIVLVRKRLGRVWRVKERTSIHSIDFVANKATFRLSDSDRCWHSLHNKQY